MYEPSSQHADLMALTAYALRGVPTLEPGVTLEVRDPQLHKVEASKSWDGAGFPEVAGFHLLRVETPSTHMRINGHPVHATRGVQRASRR